MSPPVWRRPLLSMRGGVVVAVTAVTLIAGACGGDDKDVTAEAVETSPADAPCRVVAEVDVEETVGVKVAKPTNPATTGSLPSIGVIGMRFCRFPVAPPGRGLVDVGVGAGFAAEVFDKYKTAPAHQPLIPVAGLGREAVWSEVRNTLVVLGADEVVGVYMFMPEGQQLQDKAVALASKVLQRL